MPKNRMGGAARRRRKRSMLKRDGDRCHYCKRQFPIEQLTIEHRQPYSLGGSNQLTNLSLACRSCNSRRGASPLPF